MRHRSSAVLAILLFALLLALGAGVAQAATPADTHGGPLPGNPANLRPIPASVEAPTVQAMLARVATVNGTIYSFTGAPVVGAEVYGGYVSAGDIWHYSPKTLTGATGAYSIADLQATTDGFVETWYQETGKWRGVWLSPLVFTDASTSTVDVRPGRVGWQATRGGYWKTWTSPSVRLEDSDSSGAQTSYTFDTTGSELGNAEAAPGSVTWGSINFWWDEADEWFASSPITVSAGSASVGPIEFDENNAVRCWSSTPYWGSCRPGTTVKLALHNWPAGQQVAFDGWDDSPRNSSTTFSGKTWTSPGGTSARLVSLRVPVAAKAGYGYVLSPHRVDNVDSHLRLREYIQTATLNKASVSGGVRLSGIVPTKGHWGSTAGIRKGVLIYAKTKKSGVPTKWDPSGQGWHKVASLRCTGYGVYKTGILRPVHSTWYVARYAGDSYYWGAYTNVVSVVR